MSSLITNHSSKNFIGESRAPADSRESLYPIQKAKERYKRKFYPFRYNSRLDESDTDSLFTKSRAEKSKILRQHIGSLSKSL